MNSPISAISNQRIAGTVNLLLSVSRFHIVAIASLGLFTFGWIFTGRYPCLLAGICALDWFLVNLLNRVVDQPEDQANAILGADFISRHRRALLWFGLITLILSLPLVYFVAPAITPFRISCHILGLAYNWPIRPGWRRLKQLYFWKNTASASAFLGTVFAYPLADAWQGNHFTLAAGITPWTIILSAIFFFLFELSYEVIYDLRDAPGDALLGVRTYPVVHGQPAATKIIDGLLGSSMLILVIGYLGHFIPWRIFIMICAPLIQFIYYKQALRRGITSRDCILLTWIGATLLLAYHFWVLLELPGTHWS